MEYKHYCKTDNVIGAGDVVFRHYSATPPETGGKSRFVQYVENTLTELTAEDFGDITVLPAGALYYGLDATNLEKITFPDSIKTYGVADETIPFSCTIQKELTIIFGKNTEKFATSFGGLLGSINDAKIIYDFSRVTQVPDIGTYTGSFTLAKEIRVPSALYDSWKVAWSDCGESTLAAIVAV